MCGGYYSVCLRVFPVQADTLAQMLGVYTWQHPEVESH